MNYYKMQTQIQQMQLVYLLITAPACTR
jgi:hypothetical protein